MLRAKSIILATDNFSLWTLWEFLLIKPFLKGPIPKHIFPHTFFFFLSQLRFCKLWWENLIKAKGEIQRARPKPECNQPWQGRVHCPISHRLLTRCFAKSMYQSLNCRSFHSCVTTSLGTSLLSRLGQVIPSNCPCWSCSCLAAPRDWGAGRRNTHSPAPATQSDSVPGPGKLQPVFVSDFFNCLPGMLGRLVNTCV